MKKKIPIFLIPVLFCIVFTSFLGSGIYTFADVLLDDVPEIYQEHSQWCWAGSSKAILDYYGSVQEQCVIANYAWGRDDCCGNTDFYWDNICNQPNALWFWPGSVQGILAYWEVDSTLQFSSLSWTQSFSELNNCRPFLISFRWTGGGGHALVGYGYDTNGGNYLDYMDPWNGYTRSLFTTVVSASDHTWTSTLRMTTNRPACPIPVAEAGGPYAGDPASPITFDASGSYGSDGFIVLFEWDWNNDGMYDDSTSSTTLTHTWSDSFFGTVTLRVTDNDGLSAIDTASVTIGGCFIASAAFGPPEQGKIDLLRIFRDTYLLKTPVGKAFVAIYYKYSPPVANYITQWPWLRALVRTLLLPLLGLVSLLV